MSEQKTKSERKQPWGKWYWGDWRKDIPLHACSFAARGLWADILALMAEAQHFGVLLIQGIAGPPTPRQLASLLGGSEKEVKALIAELGEAGVYSRIGDEEIKPTHIPEDVKSALPDNLPVGTLISRRMIRDKAKAQREREWGKGGGNPNLKKTTEEGYPPPTTVGLTPPVNPQIPETRVSDKKEKEPAPDGAPQDTTPEIPLSLVRPDDGDWSKPLFRQGLAYLAEVYGKPPDKLRGVVGNWLKAAGNDHRRVFGLFAQAQTQAIADPKAWITKALQTVGPGTTGTGGDEPLDGGDLAELWEREERVRKAAAAANNRQPEPEAAA